jgi:hypothetical protein
VRAAIYVLARTSGGPRFILLPMIHIGSPSYYEEVRSRLRDCDTIIFEGVRSLRGRILTLSYSIVARRKRLGLVTQSAALPLKALGAKLIHADVTAEEFSGNWMRVPWHWRIAIYLCAPLWGGYRYLVATRQSLGKGLSTDDLPSTEDVLREDLVPGFDDAILHKRDDKVIAKIKAVVSDESSRNSVVGIIYGAGHMGAVTAALMGNLQYRVVRSDWVSVFEYQDD